MVLAVPVSKCLAAKAHRGYCKSSKKLSSLAFSKTFEETTGAWVP